MQYVVRASNISKSFGRGATRIDVLQNLDLQVEPGEMVAIAGNSGSGKSTLLHILGGLLHPDSGVAEIADHDIYGLRERQRARVCNSAIGFVFQMHHLLPEFSAMENVMMPAWISGKGVSAAKQRALQLFDRMGLSARQHHRPGELSGGEQQRVAVARALINQPQVVLADEPSGNLDPANSETLHELLESLAKETGQAFLIATHSQSLARRADRALLLKQGTLEPLEVANSWT